MTGEGRVEVDTSDLERGVRQLAAGLGGTGRTVGTAQASVVAGTLRSLIPRRTGRLVTTVTVQSVTDGAEVHYGGGLPYAAYIDHRTGATDTATAGAEASFAAAMYAAGAVQVNRL
jgi:hypothetical protein